MRRLATTGALAVVVACNVIAGVDHFRLCEGVECDAATATDGSTDVVPPTDTGTDAKGPPPSCDGLAKTCGPNASDDCCATALVPGGSFSLGLVDYDTRDAAGPPTNATISTFRLDKYLVTVGRYRMFIQAVLTQAWFPQPGSGKHVHLDGGALAGEPGWASAFGTIPGTKPDWDNALGSCAGLYVPAGASYTPNPQAGTENRAINCVSWPLAYAFCIWDGGFLPTYAELDYASAGGGEQRIYPWSSPPDSGAIDWLHASYSEPQYNCTGDPLYDGAAHAPCEPGDYVVVGSKSLGNGRWGHADLAGYFDELTLDCASTFDGGACNDCVHDVVCASGQRVTHGGNYGDDKDGIHTELRRVEDAPGHEWEGFRCARPP